MESVLYVGGDDSNHAGDSKGEFIVATFSSISEDSIVKNFPNRRNSLVVDKWLEKSERDYRFTICTGEIYNSSQNLPKVLPTLIKAYIENLDYDVATVKTYLDGRLDGWAKKRMRAELLSISGIEKVVVDNFIKKRKVKGKIIKEYHCPKLVWVADTLANSLYNYSGAVSDLLKHKKMVRSPSLER